ncbi:hypothetical protein HA402_009743 [Bradysia odoriphaga]|nr:hypothetical protein HA402_009743 [Bradysia odoriphaga]
MEMTTEIYEFSSIYSSVTIDSRTISLIDIMRLCLSHKLSDDKDIPQTICSPCVRRLSDCCELKFQVEQSEQFLLNVVSNRMFMGLSDECLEINDEQSINSTAIIDAINSEPNDLDHSYSDIVAEKLLEDKVVASVPIADTVATVVAPKDKQIEEHLTKETHNCVICSKRFSTLEKTGPSFDQPTSGTHNGERPYRCQQCPKAFAQSGDLKAHERIHNGDKPYVCKICHRRFNQSSGLSSHMKSHTNERNYICFCGKSFTQSSSLARHGKLHRRADATADDKKNNSVISSP